MRNKNPFRIQPVYLKDLKELIVMNKHFQFPLKQGIGASAVPSVVNGDDVVRGQLIAYQEKDKLGTPIYSSISGKVTKVTDIEIEIEADKDQKKEFIPLKEADPLELIKQSGLVGLGGAGFPVYAKLAKPFSNGGTVIVNAAECEPILSHNIDSIEKRPKDVIRGLEIEMEVTNAAEGVIAIKKKHTAAVAILKKTLEERQGGKPIRIHLLKDMYPMGEERAIVREVLGQLLPVTSLPLEAGAIVSNVETVIRVHEAVDLKKPLIDKDLTIAGKLKGNENLIQIFHDLPIGMSVADAFAMAGGLADSYGELIMGGPFTGKRTELSSPIIKTTGGLIAAECFPKGPEKIGLLVCACGADEARMRQIAESMGSEVVGVQFCKQAAEVKGTRKCENPGKCPGQAAKVLALRKAGAQALLIGNCTDCSNTVMSCAPQLGLPVYHSTDCALRAVNHRLVRRIHEHID
jgi:proline reductase-associated electron transfer protein PrdC